MIQLDRASFLMGLVFGLTLAVVIIACSIILAPRSQLVSAAAQTPISSSAPTGTATRVLPSPTATSTPTSPPTASPPPTATPLPPATPTRPVPTATAAADNLRSQTVEVPARRSVQVSIAATAGQELELAIMADSDIDLTISDPTGATVYGPTRVRRSYNGRLRSPATGNFVLKLDNSFSIITAKQVLVQYRLQKP